jgi:hypothetical protein
MVVAVVRERRVWSPGVFCEVREGIGYWGGCRYWVVTVRLSCLRRGMKIWTFFFLPSYSEQPFFFPELADSLFDGACCDGLGRRRFWMDVYSQWRSLTRLICYCAMRSGIKENRYMASITIGVLTYYSRACTTGIVGPVKGCAPGCARARGRRGMLWMDVRSEVQEKHLVEAGGGLWASPHNRLNTIFDRPWTHTCLFCTVYISAACARASCLLSRSFSLMRASRAVQYTVRAMETLYH